MSFPKLPVPLPKNLDYSKQHIEVPGTKRPGQTAHYRNGAFPLITLDTPGSLQTLTQVFEMGLSYGANNNFLGTRPIVSKNPLKFADHYVWESWGAADLRRRAIGSALFKLFEDGTLNGGALRTVGVWSKNIPNWQIIDLACHAYGTVGVSLYDTLGPDAVEYSINHAETSIVFVASDHIPALLKLSPKTPVVKIIVSMDELSEESHRILAAWGKEKKIKVQTWQEFEDFGKANLIPPVKVTSDTVATICYTSGTTGNPKGVILTQGNLANTIHATLLGIDYNGARPVTYSFLPLAHIYERCQELCMLTLGGCIGFNSGDPLRLLEDVQILKPNHLALVPRVLNRIYQSAMAAGSQPGLKSALFHRALKAKLDRLHATGETRHPFWDRLVFNKINAVLGGRLLLVVTGSAPISTPIMDFLRISLGCDIIEGYGMTENCGTAARIWPNDPTSSSTIGGPHCNTEIKLIDVPAMGYTAEDKPFPRGEICTRGSHCFKEYYKDPVNTKATIDEEGWIHTGDVAELDECGRFKIIDRVKNIMKLAQGEYVAIERVEGLYSSSPLVAQLFVYGDSLQSYLVGAVVPEAAQLATIASRVLGTTVSPQDIATLKKVAQDPKVNAAVLRELSKEADKAGLKGFEQIKRIHITLDPFTVDNGTMTPTLKIKRKEAYRLLKTEIDALYAAPESAQAQL
ncbi:acetyl-CoA synthetase-like protein [Abortiporus biennis]|nr:acetyl-CoA synthetase-like protein [Abortiporus biennis]